MPHETIFVRQICYLLSMMGFEILIRISFLFHLKSSKPVSVFCTQQMPCMMTKNYSNGQIGEQLFGQSN
jgi:hypothetical protein